MNLVRHYNNNNIEFKNLSFLFKILPNAIAYFFKHANKEVRLRFI